MGMVLFENRLSTGINIQPANLGLLCSRNIILSSTMISAVKLWKYLLARWAYLNFECFYSGENQNFKARISPFNKYFSKCTNQREILPPVLAHRMLVSPSNRLILYLDHYQTPCRTTPSGRKVIRRRGRGRERKKTNLVATYVCTQPVYIEAGQRTHFARTNMYRYRYNGIGRTLQGVW